MEVRPARSSEVEVLAALHVAGWQYGYRDLLPAAYLDALVATDRYARWRRTLAGQDLPRQGTLVAHEGDELTGFVHFGPERRASAPNPARPTDSAPATSIHEPERRGEVYSLYVDPRRWRQGIGRALLAAAVETLAQAGHREAVLWVLDSNAKSIAFYEAVGWRRDGAIKPDEVGGQPIADVRMWLRLSPAASPFAPPAVIR